MINEKDTLKALVSELIELVQGEHAIAKECHMLAGEISTTELLELFAKYRVGPEYLGGNVTIGDGSAGVSSGIVGSVALREDTYNIVRCACGNEERSPTLQGQTYEEARQYFRDRGWRVEEDNVVCAQCLVREL